MTSTSHHSPEYDERLQEILAEYLELAEAGNAPDRETFLARYPELTDELAAFLDDRDSIEKFVAPIRDKKTTTVEIEPTIGTEEAAPPEPGEVVRYFGDYELLEEIARGGMGVVYKARQVSLNRIVALKMILAGQLASEQDVQRFHTEAEAAANLDHPNIVPVHEVGEHEGLHYFSMGFVDGHSLAERLADGPLPSREAAELTKTLADAVAYAHEQGVIHRDLKPANVLIDSRGEPRITDFGLARREDDDSGMTATGQILGTPSYMPPEQALGKNEEIGPPADVYAIGATLYALLTGRPPFQGASIAETLKQLQEQEPVTPRRLNAVVPIDLETISLKCLQKERSCRYESAKQVSAELDRYLKGEPIFARPTGRLEHVRKWAKRRPAAAALIAVSVLATLILLVGGGIFTNRLLIQRGQLAEQRDNLAEQRDVTEQRLWESLLERAKSERLAGDPAKARRSIREAAQIKQSIDLKAEAIHIATSPGFSLVRGYSKDVFSSTIPEPIQFSHDGSLIASAGPGSSQVHVWDLQEDRLLGKFVNHNGRYLFSPSELILAVGQQDGIQLWNLQSKKLVKEIKTGGIPFCFSPDGTLLAFSGQDYRSPGGMYDLNTEQSSQLPTDEQPLAFVSTDQLVIIGRQSLRRWNASTRQFDLQIDDPVVPKRNYGIRILSQSIVASRNADGSLDFWDLKTGDQLANSVIDKFKSMAINDVKGLAAHQGEDNTRSVQLLNVRTGEQVGQLVQPGYLSSDLQLARFSPDGTMLAAQFRHENTRSNVRVWDVRRGVEVAYLPDHDQPTWSPGGKWLAAFSPSENTRRSLLVYEGSAGTPRYQTSESVEALAFNRDGTELVAQDRTFDVFRSERQKLLRPDSKLPPISVGTGIRRQMFTSGRNVWRVSYEAGPPRTNLGPKEFKIQRMFPIPQSFSLKAKRFQGSGGAKSISRLAADSEGHRLVIDWNQWVPRTQEEDPVYSGGKRLEFWDLSSQKLLDVWIDTIDPSKMKRLIGYTPDGKSVILERVKGKELELCDPLSGQIQRRVSYYGKAKKESSSGVTALAMTTDSAQLFCAPGSYDHIVKKDKDGGVTHLPTYGKILAVELNSKEVRGPWKGHQGEVHVLTVSPGNRLLASGGKDKTLRIWDIESGRQIAYWVAHDAPVRSIAFHPDGKTICSGDSDGVIKLWDLDQIRRGLKEVGLDW